MTIGSHQSAKSKSVDHLTPPWLLDRLGEFETDPCASSPPRPWDIGTICNFSKEDDGLTRGWRGRVFCNPPFDSDVVGVWVKRMAAHVPGGILLVHARCETGWFQTIWKSATGLLFLDRRIKFCKPDGSMHSHNSGAPVVLATFGAEAKRRLEFCGLGGALVTGWRVQTAASAFHVSASGRRFLVPSTDHQSVSRAQAHR
jgi:hypothetical protein